MSKTSESNSAVSDGSQFKGPIEISEQRPASKSISNTNDLYAGSLNLLSEEAPIKHSMSVSGRDDNSSSSKSAFSLFPGLWRSFDSAVGFTISMHYVPRPKKTLRLFDHTLDTLSDLYKKYSESMYLVENYEGADGLNMFTKVDHRILLIQALKKDYEEMIEEKESLLNYMRVSLASALSGANGKQDLVMIDYENYCGICRSMCVIESKLERCCGKLQFQVIELDSVSRVAPLDLYELSIKLNDGMKFRSRIKVERSGRQVWDNTTFVMTPTIDDVLDIKFVELKTLNKAFPLTERKVPLINNLILPQPSIYTCWLTALGTIKLRMIVQWNAMLDDVELSLSLRQIDSQYYDSATKDGITMRRHNQSDAQRNINNRHSLNFSSLYRLDSLDKSSKHGSMGSIVEQVNEEVISDINIRTEHVTRTEDKVKAGYSYDLGQDTISKTTSLPNNCVTDKSKLSMESVDAEVFFVENDASTVVSAGPVNNGIDTSSRSSNHIDIQDQGDGSSLQDVKVVELTPDILAEQQAQDLMVGEDRSTTKGWSEDRSTTNGESEDRSTTKGWGEDRSTTNGESEDQSTNKGWGEDRSTTNGESEDRSNTKGWGEDRSTTNSESEDRSTTKGLGEDRFNTPGEGEDRSITKGESEDLSTTKGECEDRFCINEEGDYRYPAKEDSKYLSMGNREGEDRCASSEEREGPFKIKEDCKYSLTTIGECGDELISDGDCKDNVTNYDNGTEYMTSTIICKGDIDDTVRRSRDDGCKDPSQDVATESVHVMLREPHGLKTVVLCNTGSCGEERSSLQESVEEGGAFHKTLQLSERSLGSVGNSDTSQMPISNSVTSQ